MDVKWSTVVLLLGIWSHQYAAQGNRAPVFVNDMSDLALSELTPAGTFVYTLLATDVDGDSVTYEIDGDMFRVDTFTGEVFTSRVLDYETEPTLNVIVTAVDPFGNKAVTNVEVAVEDANDSPPVFEDSIYTNTVPENLAVGEIVIRHFDVSDPDTENSALTVTCDESTEQSRKSCSVFQLNRFRSSNKFWNGTLTLAQPLDYEKQSLYQYSATAFDGKNTYTQSIEILVTNLPDSPPTFIFAPSPTVNESIPLNSQIGQVIAVDTDLVEKRDIVYELIYDDECVEDMFAIGQTSGSITNTVILDRDNETLAQGYVILCIKAREVIDETNNIYGDDPSNTATVAIQVSILDVNDNNPQFKPSVYEVEIREDIQSNTPISGLIMTVTDLDSGTAGMYNFKLLDWVDVFDVSFRSGIGQTTTGIVVLDSSKIDYEVGPREYVLHVEALEADTVEKLSSTSTITIRVLDVNDNYPRFTEDIYRAEIHEMSPGGTPVINIQATDPDSGDFGTSGIMYSLAGNGADKFDINRLTGFVTVANCATPGTGNCIDYEKKKQYVLTVIAADSRDGKNALTTNNQLTVDILDDNDNSPYFNQAEVVRYIEEKDADRNPEVNLQAIDVDTVGGPITYSIVSQDPAGLWTIHPTQGVVTATREILYTDTPGNQGFFYITIRATDGKYDATYNAKINVIDKNDKTPVFTPSSYTETIPEQTPPDTLVLTVLAVDDDSPTSAAGQIDYKFDTGSQGKFDINSASGEIRTASDATFDYDVQDVFEMIVLATDRGQPQLTATATVTILIRDENNKDPYFEPSTQRTTVYENADLQSSFYQVLAFDPDEGARLNYYFTEPKTAVTIEGVFIDRNQYDFTDLFVIERETGIVRTNKKLDRDKASVVTYRMTVVDVSANTPQNGTGTLIITILENNDQSPYFLPYTNITIDEEQPIHSYIMVLQARDEDDAIASYEMLVNPRDLFDISFRAGVVSVKSRIDYEVVQSAYFEVIAFDDGTPHQLSATAGVYVTIRNINDNTPIFDSESYQATILENSQEGAHVVTVSASDHDLEEFGEIRFNISDPKGQFLIDPITGVITVAPNAVLDRETTEIISIQVIAYDTPNNPDPNVRRYNTVPVYITLNDINDNDPIFTKTEYFAEIIETIPENTQVLQLFAKDADYGQNANIYFFKEANTGDDNDFFSVSQRSGHISVGKSLLGYYGTYRFQVKAIDGGGTGPNIAYAYVTIDVLPATNAPPEWIIPRYENMTIYVLESQYLGMLVYEVYARDQDRGANGIVSYGFYDFGEYTRNTGEFKMNAVTGVIRAEIVYDREQVDRYDLLLVARDNGDPYLETTRFLTVKILDVNDNPPVFPIVNDETYVYRFNVEEGKAAGTVFGTVEATDADLDLYAKIYYHIIAGNEEGKFAINTQTGELHTTAVLDREDEYIYTLDVQATNNVSDYSVVTSRKKREVDPSIARVIITISDKNDMPPVFTQEQYYGCISTRAAFGESILRVEATDMDSPGKVDISYVIIEGNNDGIFKIDPDTGVITNIKFLTSDADKTYDLVIEAQDPTNVATARVLIFVHEHGQGVKLEIGQPVSEVRSFLDQIKGLMEESDNIDYVCISDIVDHQTGDGSSSLRSDVYLSAVRKVGSSFQILGADELKTILEKERNENKDAFDLIYIRNIETAEEEKDFLDGTPVLAVVIIIAVLIFLALLFIIIAYVCIKQSKQRKKHRIETKRLIADQPVVINPNLNPVYDNRGYESESVQAQYSQVHKSGGVLTVMDTTDMEVSAQPAVLTVTETVPEREREPSPEPQLSTAIFAVEPEDTIEVEIQDSVHSSPKSSRPSSPRAEDVYRIEADVL